MGEILSLLPLLSLKPILSQDKKQALCGERNNQAALMARATLDEAASTANHFVMKMSPLG